MSPSQDSITTKIAKLQAATDEAKDQMDLAKQTLDAATKELADCKARYKNLSQSDQETMQVNDTELPNLLETQIRARNVYETVVARYATNLRYLNAMKQREQ